MNKLFSVIILAIFAHGVVSDGIPVNGQCVSIVGPLGYCDEGLTCCILNPDNGVCLKECPVPLGGQCGTIVGTKPCVDDIPCCFISPDNGICQTTCDEQK